MNDSVIVYRSRAEQLQDEFLWDMIESYPEAFLWVLGTVAGIIISAILAFLFAEVRIKKSRFKR